MPVVTIDDLISSDEEAAPPAPTGRLAPGSLARAAHRARKPQRAPPAAQRNAKATSCATERVVDYLSSSDGTDQSPSPAAGTTHAALRQAAQVAQLRSRLEAPSPATRRFTFQSPPPSPALDLPTLPGEGSSSLLQEAGATGQAALDEAALYDAAAGAALSEHMTSLLRAAPSGDAAAEAALQAAVQSLSACQQQESLRLQRSVASLRADLRERLLCLEREFVSKAELLANRNPTPSPTPTPTPTPTKAELLAGNLSAAVRARTVTVTVTLTLPLPLPLSLSLSLTLTLTLTLTCPVYPYP